MFKFILQSQFHPSLSMLQKIADKCRRNCGCTVMQSHKPQNLDLKALADIFKTLVTSKTEKKKKKREEEKKCSYFETVANNQLNRVSILLLYPVLNPSPFFSIIRDGQFRKRTRQPTPRNDSVKRENRQNFQKNVE